MPRGEDEGGGLNDRLLVAGAAAFAADAARWRALLDNTHGFATEWLPEGESAWLRRNWTVAAPLACNVLLSFYTSAAQTPEVREKTLRVYEGECRGF